VHAGPQEWLTWVTRQCNPPARALYPRLQQLRRGVRPCQKPGTSLLLRGWNPSAHGTSLASFYADTRRSHRRDPRAPAHRHAGPAKVDARRAASDGGTPTSSTKLAAGPLQTPHAPLPRVDIVRGRARGGAACGCERSREDGGSRRHADPVLPRLRAGRTSRRPPGHP
jgi:hypothetical protein